VAKRDWSILGLLVCLLGMTGCAVLPEPARTTSWLRRQNPFAKSIDDQEVKLFVALLERPIEDPFINQELWSHTDEMIVDMDRKAAVDDNGYRVGQIVGMPPGKLQDLLKSERYCLNSRCRIMPSGHSVPVFLGPVLPTCEFVVQEGKNTHEETLDKTRFCFDVKGTLTNDGKTRLTFTPKVEYGENTLPFVPDPDQNAWTIRIERPSTMYKELSWDVVLAPGEYLVVGAILDKDKSLGHRSFVQEEGTGVQRLLVLRTARSVNGGDSHEPTMEDIARSQTSPCLALQASMTAVRGSGE